MAREVTYETWIAYATADIELAEHAATTMFRPPHELICFHCQQCAEKMLKAFLVARGTTPQKTHDLALLLSECVRFNSEFLQVKTQTARLKSFATETRYPDGIDLTEYEAKISIKLAREVYEFTLQHIQ